MAGGFDADESLRLFSVEVWERFAERGRQRVKGGDPFGRDAQDGFAEAIDFVRSALECGGVRIADCTGDDDLQRVA